MDLEENEDPKVPCTQVHHGIMAALLCFIMWNTSHQNLVTLPEMRGLGDVILIVTSLVAPTRHLIDAAH